MFWQQLVNGIALGAIYALITIGYNMVFGIMRLMNFAHGDVYMFGTFVTWMCLTSLKMNIFFALLLGVAAGGLIASFVEYTAYRPLRDENRVISMITAIGAGYIIQNSEEIFWGVEVQRFPSLFPADTINIWGLNIPTVQLFTFILAFLIILGFSVFLKYHKVGKAIMCMSQDIPTSSLMGVPINRTITIIYFLGGVLGVISGVLYASAYNAIAIKMGFAGTIVAFTAAVFGGLGNLKGGTIGSFVLGVIQIMAGAYVSTAFKDVVGFGLLIVILLFFPRGIIGEKIVNRV